MNVRAIHAAISEREGSLDIPQPDYMVNSSFASFELRKSAATENIGQAIDYENRLVAVRAVSIDSLNLPWVDLIKLDVEGMEALALAGARQTIERCKPIVSVEIVKSDRQQIAAYFAGLGYVVLPAGLNVLAGHKTDPALKQIGK
jgi:FkbM family methyltransferase